MHDVVLKIDHWKGCMFMKQNKNMYDSYKISVKGI